jgi:hypothetical protein
VAADDAQSQQTSDQEVKQEEEKTQRVVVPSSALPSAADGDAMQVDGLVAPVADPPAAAATDVVSVTSPSTAAVSAVVPVIVLHPTEILSREHYFEQLFSLLSLSVGSSSAGARIQEEAWKLLMELPTNRSMLQRIQTLRSAHATPA